MKIVAYALTFAVIFLPSWFFARWACIEGPLDVSWKMAAGAVTLKITEGIYNAILSMISQAKGDWNA